MQAYNIACILQVNLNIAHTNQLYKYDKSPTRGVIWGG